jgi:hypothetical protein
MATRRPLVRNPSNQTVEMPLDDGAAVILKTQAEIDALISVNGISAGAMYLIDSSRIAIGLTATTINIMPRITVSTTAPASPQVNDIWIDTN